MSDPEIWYFVKGEESVGPFSIAMLHQIFEAGQLNENTLVWKEGMSQWMPAGQIQELHLHPPNPVVTPESKVFHPTSVPAKIKLRLKESSSTPLPSESTPLKITPSVSPASKNPKTEAPSASTSVSRQAQTLVTSTGVSVPAPSLSSLSSSLVLKKKSISATIPPEGFAVEKTARPSALRRVVQRVFSSLVMTPLFLILVGFFVGWYHERFPNVLWIIWFISFYSLLGFLSLIGIRSLDGIFRWVALIFALPPVALFWPVIMHQIPVQQMSLADWMFSVWCFFYLTTIRIGFRSFLGDANKIAVFTGVISLGFVILVTQSSFFNLLPGWVELTQNGRDIRLPGIIARTLNMPSLGTCIGHLKMQTPGKNIEIGIESLFFVKGKGTELQLQIQTLQDLRFVTKLTSSTEQIEKLRASDLPIFFPKKTNSDELFMDEESSRSIQVQVANQALDIKSAFLSIEKIEKKRVYGTLVFNLSNDQVLNATFESRMTGR